ncbi:hypothetical protein L1987_46378 [Smallanthus sonchifolius]|uniref:Uncharacterized protein n=1 Tax=Smallanthus sonchifolius TaxID=185202 RepID=A0ACB9G1B2_9ASTR|nr:hypothetical protein L1987_46378 [Smallanthus sonchifolius]
MFWEMEIIELSAPLRATVQNCLSTSPPQSAGLALLFKKFNKIRPNLPPSISKVVVAIISKNVTSLSHRFLSCFHRYF